ncbi:MAG: DinB family protein [Anaerolineae bacterium]|nr:DinB family protein [Anaerolineae bacterium]
MPSPNPPDEIARLIRVLDKVRERTLSALDSVDPESVLHPASGWRVKDVVMHIAAWDDEAAKALRAYCDGISYAIAGYTNEDAFNQAVYEQYRDQPFENIKAELDAARERFKAAIRALPADRLDGDMVYPWRGVGTARELPGLMATHEKQHADEIRRTSQPGE